MIIINRRELWEKYIGDPTPEEFMRLSGTANIHEAVNDYLESHEFTQDVAPEERHLLFRELVNYIETDRIEFEWEPGGVL